MARFVVPLVLAELAACSDVEVQASKAAGTVGVKVESRAV
jgi:hypothetical protein